MLTRRRAAEVRSDDLPRLRDGLSRPSGATRHWIDGVGAGQPITVNLGERRDRRWESPGPLLPPRIRWPANAEPINPAPTTAIRCGSPMGICALLADKKRNMSAVSMRALRATCQPMQPRKTSCVDNTGRLTYLVI